MASTFSLVTQLRITQVQTELSERHEDEI